MLLNVLVAVAAVASPVIALGPPPNIAPTPPKVGCMVDSDCSHGQICQHNICAMAPTPPKLGCMVDSDCSDGQICQHNICIMAPTPPKLGCMFNSDCSNGQVCQHNVCIMAPIPPRVGCMFDSDCGYRQVCRHNVCVAGKKPKSTISTYCEECEKTETKSYNAPPKPTITIIECKECEDGYTTSTCYPDFTVTVTACDTCLQPTTPCTVPVVPPPPTSSICRTAGPTPPMPIWVSGAGRTHIAFAGTIGVVAMAALMI